MKKIRLQCPNCHQPAIVCHGTGDSISKHAEGKIFTPYAITCPRCGLTGKAMPSVRMAVRIWTMNTEEEWDAYDRERREATEWIAKALRIINVYWYQDHSNPPFDYIAYLETEAEAMTEIQYTQVLQCLVELYTEEDEEVYAHPDSVQAYDGYYDSIRVGKLIQIIKKVQKEKIHNSEWLDALDAKEKDQQEWEMDWVWVKTLAMKQIAMRVDQAWIRQIETENTCPACGKQKIGDRIRDRDRVRFCSYCGAQLTKMDLPEKNKQVLRLKPNSNRI